MTDFEVHPVGTGAKLDELNAAETIALNTPQQEKETMTEPGKGMFVRQRDTKLEPTLYHSHLEAWHSGYRAFKSMDNGLEFICCDECWVSIDGVLWKPTVPKFPLRALSENGEEVVVR